MRTGQDGRVQYGEQPPENKPAKRVESAIVASPTTLVEVEIEDSTMKYFPVYGTNARELQASILANGPFK